MERKTADRPDTDRQTDRLKIKRMKGGQADRQKDRQTDRQTDRQMD